MTEKPDFYDVIFGWQETFQALSDIEMTINVLTKRLETVETDDYTSLHEIGFADGAMWASQEMVSLGLLELVTDLKRKVQEQENDIRNKTAEPMPPAPGQLPLFSE